MSDKEIVALIDFCRMMARGAEMRKYPAAYQKFDQNQMNNYTKRQRRFEAIMAALEELRGLKRNAQEVRDDD